MTGQRGRVARLEAQAFRLLSAQELRRYVISASPMWGLADGSEVR